MQTILLPVPPSANNAYANRRKGKGYGRIKTERHRAWLKAADDMYVLQKLNACPRLDVIYRCEMIFPPIRGDLDGRAKLILDWLVSRQLTIDDKHCYRLEQEIDGNEQRYLVTVMFEPWQPRYKSEYDVRV